jgi:hypothetical protein
MTRPCGDGWDAEEPAGRIIRACGDGWDAELAEEPAGRTIRACGDGRLPTGVRLS